jgi:predicted nucleic acid-binding protein
MPGEGFIDTNVLVYAFAQNDPRSAVAEEFLAQGGAVSVQVLNEFVSIARRKLQMSWEELREALSAIRVLCPNVIPITVDTHEAALRIAEKYRYGIYDALILAAALEGGYETVFSEDFQDGQILDGKLQVRNPFRPSRKDR